MKNHILCLAALALVGMTGISSGQIVINEFSYDEVGSDEMEYVELYNPTANPVDMSGWLFLSGTSEPEQGVTFPSGTIIPANGFYMIGTKAKGSALVPHIDIYLGVVYRNYESYLTLQDGTGNIIDSVAYSIGENSTTIQTGQGEPPSTATEGTVGGIWGYSLTGEQGDYNGNGFAYTGEPNATLTFQRNPDPEYLDTDNNERDFQLAIATPNAANFSRGTITPAQIAAGLTFDFEGADGTPETLLPGNFSSVFNHDPTVADTITVSTRYAASNPSAIPAAPAPGGGNIGLSWSTANLGDMGYSNANILPLTEPILNVEAESLVYIGNALVGTQFEVGDFIVLRGRPDAHHFFGYDATNPERPNGDVGVRIRFANNVAGSGQVNLYVEQHIDGITTSYGDPVPIPTAGWYRILLSVNEGNVAAIIGGTYGSYVADGTLAGGIKFPADPGQPLTTTIMTPGGIGMNYHTEIPADPADLANVRPLTYDHLTFRAPVLAGSSGVSDWTLY